MLTTANDEEEEAEETTTEPAPIPDEDPEAVRAHYMRSCGLHATDDLWHQRLGHPSHTTLKNCIEAGVFAPGALLQSDGTEVRSTLQPHNCTVCPEVALSHQPFPLVVGYCGTNNEQYTLTFIDAGTRYVWVVNLEVRSRAYEAFRLWLAHAQRQSREKLKIWQSDGAVEFRSKEIQDYLAQKEIEHHDEVAASILEQETRGKFTRGDRHSSDDDDEDPLGGGVGGAGGSGRGAAPPPPEPESDLDDVQEVTPQHRHDNIVSGIQLLGLHTATSTAPRVIEPMNPRQALTGPNNKEWREAIDAEIKALESRDTWVLVDRTAVKGRRNLSGKWVFRVKTTADGTIERR
ncbi:unnamed protein product [Closterium sp. NIES-53]